MLRLRFGLQNTSPTSQFGSILAKTRLPSDAAYRCYWECLRVSARLRTCCRRRALRADAAPIFQLVRGNRRNDLLAWPTQDYMGRGEPPPHIPHPVNTYDRRRKYNFKITRYPLYTYPLHMGVAGRLKIHIGVIVSRRTGGPAFLVELYTI